MTDPRETGRTALLREMVRDLNQRDARITELERWQDVDLANYKRHLDELTEMLTAATDTALQRGKAEDAVQRVRGAIQWLRPPSQDERFLLGWNTIRDLVIAALGGSFDPETMRPAKVYRLERQLDAIREVQEQPDHTETDWGRGWANGWNDCLYEIHAVMAGGVPVDRVTDGG